LKTRKKLFRSLRVAKPGGYIGLIEVYLINNERKIPEKVLDSLDNSDFFHAEIMREKDYRQLLEKVKLPITYDRVASIEAGDEARNLADRFG
jgi:hypothetical protein